MGRARKNRIFPAALSIDACAEALSCPRSKIAAAVYKTGELPAYVGSNRSVRVLVKDLVAWVESTWPRAVKRRSKSP
jgi:hypothetical protein